MFFRFRSNKSKINTILVKISAQQQEGVDRENRGFKK